MSTPFIFGSPSYNTSEVFYARLNGDIYKKEQLFDVLYHLLWFPYFGFNWDALDECLRDFSWIKEKVVVIAHNGLPKLPEEDLKMYLDVLRYALQNRHPDAPRLEVVFDEHDRKKVNNLLSQSITQVGC